MQIIHQRVCFEGLYLIRKLHQNFMLLIKFRSQFKAKLLMPLQIIWMVLLKTINSIQRKLGLLTYSILLVNQFVNRLYHLLHFKLYYRTHTIPHLLYLFIVICRSMCILIKVFQLHLQCAKSSTGCILLLFNTFRLTN